MRAGLSFPLKSMIMKTVNELQVCFLLSLAFHSGLIGGGLLNFQNPNKAPFEVKFEVQEEILPRQYEITEEKRIEKESAEPIIQQDLIEEISEKEDPKPEEIDEELKRSLLRYQDSVKQKIQEEKKYPRKALRLRKEGTTRINFSLLSSGNIQGIRLLSSSGVTDLDEEAMDAVRRASPFRPFPQGLDKEELQFEIDIAFIITQNN